jgi:nucleoside-diphosphate-sugar epimerase
MTTYLVTGASGFLGGHLVNELVAGGAHVTAVDRRAPDDSVVLYPSTIACINFIQLDLRDAHSTADLIGRVKPDIIYHLAAQPISLLSNLDPLGTAQDNIMATYGVLEGVRNESPKTKLIFTSSACFYGVPTSEPPLSEADPPSVGDYVYTATKIAADFAVRHYRSIFSLPCSVIRFVNIYGPGDRNHERIVPRLALQALRGLPPTLTQSDGRDTLSFLYVDDAISALRIVAEHPSALGRPVWNVSGSEPISIYELMRLVYGLTGKSPDSFARVGRHHRSVRKYLDGSAADDALGLESRVDLERGLVMTLDWYRERLGYFSDMEASVTGAPSG